ncbi:MAG: zinc ribbon domain-containing protein [Sedimentibacter sp.]
MNNISTFSIPKDVVSKAGNALGIKANQLAGYFGLAESTESKLPEEGWENILPVLLQPLNFSGIIALFQDDSLLFTNILTGENDAMFCGEEDGNLKVMPMSQLEIIELLASYLGETKEPSKIKQELSADALIAMMSIADSIRRAKLENILDPSKNSFEIKEESLNKEFESTVKSGDLRWIAPFLAELRWESKPVDFSKALNELSKLGIIRLKNGKVNIDEKGEVFFEELLKRRTIIGIRSVFYHKGVLNYLSMAFLRTENYLWFLDVTDNACMMSLKYDELKGMIAAMISPGEAPPEETATAEITDKAKEKVKTPKFCKSCGAKLSDDAKFCKSCGKKIG